MLKHLSLSLPLSLPLLLLLSSPALSNPGNDHGQAPAVRVNLDGHDAKPATGLNMMGVYATNFGETPYCCPWNPKAFEIAPPPTKGWGVVPMICQVADAGTGGVFNENGTVLVGNSWLFSNGSVAFFGHAGSRNGAYMFGFAMDLKFKKLKGFFTFQDEKDSTMDGGFITGPWDWTFLRDPTVDECRFALRQTEDTISPLKSCKDEK